MKVCSICKISKEETEFNKNSSKRDKLSTVCKVCSQERSKKYYRENIEKHRKVVVERNQRRRRENQSQLLEFLQGQQCTDCGTEDYRVFEFDHVRGVKRANVSQLIIEGHSWKVIQEEIDKCEIVCANCHRIRTFTRSNNYRILL